MKSFLLFALFSLLSATHVPAADETEKPITTTLRIECFSMQRVPARRAFLTHPKPAELYQWLVGESEKVKPLVKFEEMSVLRCLAGQRSKVTSSIGLVYPTEFDPAQIPQSSGTPAVKPTATPPPDPAPAKTAPPTPSNANDKPAPSGNQGDIGLPGPALTQKTYDFPYSPITPTSFETRETGWDFEVESTISEDKTTVDLLMVPALVALAKKISYDKNGESWQPIFSAQRLNTNISCKVNEPTLVGTMNPSPDAGVGIPEQKNQVWFLYVTVSLQ